MTNKPTRNWIKDKNIVEKLETVVKTHAMGMAVQPMTVLQVAAARLMLAKLRPSLKPVEASSADRHERITEIRRVIIDEVDDITAPDRPDVTPEQRAAERLRAKAQAPGDDRMLNGQRPVPGCVCPEPCAACGRL
jgi:hypothetical protein